VGSVATFLIDRKVSAGMGDCQELVRIRLLDDLNDFFSVQREMFSGVRRSGSEQLAGCVSRGFTGVRPGADEGRAWAPKQLSAFTLPINRDGAGSSVGTGRSH
jgi:hypothetical protein